MNRHLALPLAVLLTTVGCGEDIAPDSDADLVVIAEDIDFDADTYEVTAGEIAIELFQRGAIRHTLLIEDNTGADLGIRLDVDARGSADTDTVVLEAGTYTLYCDVPGHLDAGMVATLSVNDPSQSP
ncbi:MAG: plastocyanin/azurin family copper-binding protein [Actinomycetota bacterium]